MPDYDQQGASGFTIAGHKLAPFSSPLVLLIYVANILSVVWLDYLYGIGIGFRLPTLCFRI